MTVLIDERCTACGACLSTCPEHALTRAPRRPVVDATRCTDCWECIEICPPGAISAFAGPAAEMIRELAEVLAAAGVVDTPGSAARTENVA